MPDESQIAQGPEADRERWNRKYRAEEKYRGEEAGSRGPDGLLAEACAGMAGGDALDLAGGAGRHAIWLAQQGWRVVVSDVSDEGLAVAARRAAEEGVRLELRRESAAETMAWAGSEGGRRFDLVAVFWFLERERFAALPGR